MKNKDTLEVKKNFASSFKSIAWYFKKFKFETVFIFIASIVSSILSAGVIFAQYYFLNFLQSSIFGQVSNETNKYIFYLLILFTSLILSFIILVIQSIIMAKLSQYICHAIKKDIFEKILKLKLSFFDQNPSGDIMSRLTNDANNISVAISENVTTFISSITQMLAMLLGMLLFSPILSIVAIVWTPIQLFIIYFLLKISQPNFHRKQKIIGNVNSFIEETVSGHNVIKNFSQEKNVIKEFIKRNKKLEKNDVIAQNTSGLTSPINLFSTTFVTVIVLIIASVLGKHNFQMGGIITTLKPNGETDTILVISLINVFLLFQKQFSNPLFQIFQVFSTFQAAFAGSSRVFAINNEQEEVMFSENVDIKNIKGKVKFDNLNFSYDGKKQVLKNINLNVNAGEVVGIVGPTGSGKTTIINLLTKFYDVTDEKSDILMDGKSIKTFTKNSLRDEVSIVLQDSFLFDDTIFNNMRYAKPSATNEEIIEAAKKANAHHFITSLENGYDTILINNADILSQGERQLLAITRAFLKQSSILILDEATSSIDSRTEKLIQSGMLKLSKGKTTFMIAHRLSTIKHADKILVLKDGEILELGNHKQLIKKQGFYYNMYNSGLNTPEDV